MSTPGNRRALLGPRHLPHRPLATVAGLVRALLLVVPVVLVVLLAALPLAAPAAAGTAPTPPTTDEGTDPERGVGADPLEVTIDALAPSVLPTSGVLQVSGQVSNRSAGDWTDLSVYLVVSGSPLTTDEELVRAVDSHPRTDVGDRIVAPGLFATVDDLAPGETADYQLSVPAGALPITGAAGVYWLAVHVLGTSEEGRLEGADGRARTFLPHVPDGTPGTRLSLGVQLRERVQRTAGGRLVDAGEWAAAFGDDGALGRLVRLAADDDGWPLTWVVDPAVVDAAVLLGRGNPPLDLAGEPGTAEPPGDDVEAERSTGAREAEEWLGLLTERLGDRPVLALPYADIDVPAAADAASNLVDAAVAESRGLLEDLEVDGAPAVVLPPVQAPLDVDPEAVLRAVAADTVALVPAATAEDVAAPVLEATGGRTVVVAPVVPDRAGPGPDSRDSALAVRQRLLADSALHALSPDREQPLVRLLPASWDPGPRWREADLFEGLDVPWLTGTSLAGLADSAPTAGEVTLTGPDADGGAGATEVAAPLPESVVRAAEELVGTAAELDELLTANDVLTSEITRQALTSVSLWAREDPWDAAEQARQALVRVRGWLAQVTVASPTFVTMSSESGTFQVSLVNGLDQPVTVGLRTTVDGADLELSSPAPVVIGPRGRGAMRVDAVASDIGVHQVTLQAVSAEGTPVGAPTTISVRSSNVGAVLWVIMAVGGSLLFVAVVVRIVRRVRQRRRTHGPLLASDRGAR